MQLRWDDLGTGRADAAHDTTIELAGFAATPLPVGYATHCLLVPEAACCAGCVPRDPLGAVEVFAAAPLPVDGRPVRLTGTWRRRTDDANPWRYQLHDARLTEPAGWSAVGRRFVLRGAPLMCLAAVAAPQQAAVAQQRDADARQAIGRVATVDMHSHAGHITRVRDGTSRLGPVAAPMTAGGMAAVCFAIVSDSPCHHLVGGQIHPYRSPDPGELYAWSQRGFRRLHALIGLERLAVIANAASLSAARGGTPSAIVAAEGGDFLEGRPERVDEAYERWQLRHLQLTHYRVNELGDIQTESPEHGGLTDVGAEVIRRCNRLGVVVDVAHGTFDLVKRAASVTTKPLILSHTSMTPWPRPRSRLITPDHARLIAGTGGVVGVWPVQSIYADLNAMAYGMARLADVVGVDHVGLGTDMLGLVGPSSFSSYRQLPELAAALLGVGFGADDVGKVLGGNYGRVFAATMS
ncbi:MAG TPA: membrane dipeptidase [Acetobacteraceae bacterium]|jgi:membrane dipeptidase